MRTMAARMNIAKIVTPYRMQRQRHNAEEAEEKMLKKCSRNKKYRRNDRQTERQAGTQKAIAACE